MKYEIAKLAVSALVSTSTGMVVGNAVKATLPVGAGLIKKIGFGIGAVVIGEMIGNKASQYVDSQIDEVREAVNISRGFGASVKSAFSESKDEETDKQPEEGETNTEK